MHSSTAPTGPGVVVALDSRLLGVSLSEIATFLALVEHNGFSAAARALNVSQPGVSSRIRRLERALGVVLVDRSIRQFTLTREGEVFLPLARHAAGALEVGRRRARAAIARPAS